MCQCFPFFPRLAQAHLLYHTVVAPQCALSAMCGVFSRLVPWRLGTRCQAPNKCHPTLLYNELTVAVAVPSLTYWQNKTSSHISFSGCHTVHMWCQRWTIRSFLSFLPGSKCLFHFNAPG